VLTARLPMAAILRFNHKGFVRNVKEKADEKGEKGREMKAFTRGLKKLVSMSLFFLTWLMGSLLFTQCQ